MALSNMLNEPRREITETVIGLIIVVPIVLALGWVDYLFAEWFVRLTNGPPGVETIVFCMLLGLPVGALLVIVGVGAAFAIHAAGEDFCNALERRGVRLRPIR